MPEELLCESNDQEHTMATNAANKLIHHLRRAALAVDGAGLSDGELLELYAIRRDAAAFEALVRRHGPMVLRVCRRVQRNCAKLQRPSRPPHFTP